MKKIVVTQPMSFSPEQKARLDKLGDVTYFDELAVSPEEWLKRCEGADAVCSGIFGLRDAYADLKDIFVSVPFVGVGSFADPQVLKTNNITLCNSPGSNRHAVSEWIVFMIIESLRDLAHYINSDEEPVVGLPPAGIGLAVRKLTVLGKGNIGSRVGAVCEALEMEVSYFTRGDDLAESVKEADVVVDCLTANPTTMNLLNGDFFESMKDGSYFVSVTVDSIVDIDAMLKAVDSGKLAGVAHDVMNAKLGDTSNPLFIRLKTHPKVKATPHISGFSDVSSQIGNDMMIANVEAWLAGSPTNVFGK